jgi:hypothetical protein
LKVERNEAQQRKLADTAVQLAAYESLLAGALPPFPNAFDE